MKKEKYYLALDDYEKRVIINCLNKMRKLDNFFLLHIRGQKQKYFCRTYSFWKAI